MNNPHGEARPDTGSVAAALSATALSHALLDRSPLLVYAVDPAGRLLLANRAFVETTGWSETECSDLNSLLERLYPDPHYREVVHRVHQGRSAGSQLDGMELTLRCKDGSDALVSWSTAWLTDPAGQILGYAFLGTNSTSLRNLRHLLFLFRSAVEGISEGVILTDPAGRIFSWNAAATSLLGHEGEAMEGRVLAELYEDGDALEAGLRDSGRFEGSMAMLHSDGSRCTLAVLLQRLETGAGAQAARLCVLTSPDREAELTDRIDDLTGTIHELEKALDEQGKSAELHEASLAELNAKLREQTSSTVETVDALRQEHLRDRASSEEALVAAKGRTDEVTSLYEGLQDKHRHTEELLAAEKLTADDVRRDLAVAEKKAEEANQRAADSEEKAREAQERYDKGTELLAEIQSKLVATQEEVATTQADLTGQEQELERLAAALAASQQRLQKVDEERDRERNESEERHRNNLEALSQRLAAERLSLEEQISRDILAAEDRAAVQRDQNETDRAKWEAAIAAARAESDAQHRAEIEELRGQLASSGNELGTDQVISRGVAVAAADMNGVVVGWSDGASSLDGYSQKEALGKRIHEDVLCLEGIDWKTLVGKIIVSGHLEQEHVLISSDGIRTPILLIADLVRGKGGAPTGLTEFIAPQPAAVNEGEITDVSDIMELVEEDETEAMSLRGNSEPTFDAQASKKAQEKASKPRKDKKTTKKAKPKK